jgi:hypothetical protein
VDRGDNTSESDGSSSVDSEEVLGAALGEALGPALGKELGPALGLTLLGDVLGLALGTIRSTWAGTRRSTWCSTLRRRGRPRTAALAKRNTGCGTKISGNKNISPFEINLEASFAEGAADSVFC